MSRSSIVTVVPSGVVQDWCMHSPWSSFDHEPQQCANATRGTEESDFQSICCDGMIIDTTKNIWRAGGEALNIDNLVCCRVHGPQAGGLQPLGEPTTCESGTPVPLTSLAATNILNAQEYLVTYTSASFGGPTPGDFVPTKTPYCLWAYTKSGVEMATITVEAAQITPLSTSSGYLATMGDGIEVSPSSTSTQSSETTSTTSSSSRISLSNSYIVGIVCGLMASLGGRLF